MTEEGTEPNVEPSASPESAPAVGGEYASMVSGLAPELSSNPHVSRHQDLHSLATDHVNAQAMIGRKGVILPSEDPSDINRFLGELGRPATPGDYVRPEGQSDEALGVAAEFRGNIDGLLHEGGITQGQYDKIVPAWSDLVAKQTELMMQGQRMQAAEAIESLKAEYGSAYSSKMAAGQRALAATMGEKADEVLELTLQDGTLLGNNSDFVRGLIKMGEEHYVDDSLVDTRGVRVSGAMQPDVANAEIKSLMATKEFTDQYFDKSHAGHAEANAKMENLYLMAHPPQAR